MMMDTSVIVSPYVTSLIAIIIITVLTFILEKELLTIRIIVYTYIALLGITIARDTMKKKEFMKEHNLTV